MAKGAAGKCFHFSEGRIHAQADGIGDARRAHGQNALMSITSAVEPLPLPEDHEDRGVYVVEGRILIAGTPFAAGQMMVFRPGDRISLTAGEAGARLMVLGSEGPRYFSWN